MSNWLSIRNSKITDRKTKAQAFVETMLLLGLMLMMFITSISVIPIINAHSSLLYITRDAAMTMARGDGAGATAFNTARSAAAARITENVNLLMSGQGNVVTTSYTLYSGPGSAGTLGTSNYGSNAAAYVQVCVTYNYRLPNGFLIFLNNTARAEVIQRFRQGPRNYTFQTCVRDKIDVLRSRA